MPHKKENMYRKSRKMKKTLEKTQTEWYYGNVTFWACPKDRPLADLHEKYACGSFPGGF